MGGARAEVGRMGGVYRLQGFGSGSRDEAQMKTLRLASVDGWSAYTTVAGLRSMSSSSFTIFCMSLALSLTVCMM